MDFFVDNWGCCAKPFKVLCFTYSINTKAERLWIFFSRKYCSFVPLSQQPFKPEKSRVTSEVKPLLTSGQLYLAQTHREKCRAKVFCLIFLWVVLMFPMTRYKKYKNDKNYSKLHLVLESIIHLLCSTCQTMNQIELWLISFQFSGPTGPLDPNYRGEGSNPNTSYNTPSLNKRTTHDKTFLADPGKARGCSTNSLMIY